MNTNLIYKSWPIDKLIEYANNPRKNDHAVEKIAEAIKYFGFRIPIVAKSDGTVIDGHLRLKAARQLGMTKVPVVLADDLTDEQIRGFRISVNKMSELADWDEDLLRAELLDLQSIEFDMDLLGFEGFELSNFFGEENDIYGEWIGMPEFNQQNKQAFRSLIIHFKDNNEVQEFSRQINKKLTEKTRSLWYSDEPIDSVKDLRIKSEP